MRILALTGVVAMISLSVAVAQDIATDPIQKKLDFALTKYDAAVDEAAEQLLKLLDSTRNLAQKRGNLGLVQSIDSEIKAFKADLVLPKSVSTSSYERSTQRAVARVQAAYEKAVRDYTKDNQILLAKQIKSELDMITKSGIVAVDPLRKHRIWVSSDPPRKFSIIRLAGGKFQARLRLGERIDRLVTGTADTKSLNWKATDVVVYGGKGPGGDNAGTIHKDENGYRIDFQWKDSRGNGGKYTLRPKTN